MTSGAGPSDSVIIGAGPNNSIIFGTGLLYLTYGNKEKTSTGWRFFNNYMNKKEKQGDKAKNQLYKFVAYNIKWKSESWCEARVHGRSRML